MHQKISQNPYFYRLNKSWPSYWLTLPWPSYWLYFGQNVAKLLALQHIYMYIYIYTRTFLVNKKCIEEGDKNSQCSCLVVILSNWVPENWVFPFQRFSFLAQIQRFRKSRDLGGWVIVWPNFIIPKKGLILRNARPATGIQNPETRNSSKKNSKITPRAPTPNSLKKTRKILKNTRKIVFSEYF